jgi:hypothetical protein
MAAAASANLVGSAESGPAGGRPEFTLQNWQRRVQVSPRIMKVAVLWLKH